jgi:hypothetical protein
MLRSMKLLPDMSITEDTLANHRSDTKGKQKARDDGEGSSVGKKWCVDDDDDEDDNSIRESNMEIGEN